MIKIKEKDNKQEYDLYHEDIIFKDENYTIKLVIKSCVYFNLEILEVENFEIKDIKIQLVIDGENEEKFFDDIKDDKFFSKITNKILNRLKEAEKEIKQFLKDFSMKM